jgi:hypothetical protein
MNTKEMGWEVVNWITLAQDTDHWALSNMVMKWWVQ